MLIAERLPPGRTSPGGAAEISRESQPSRDPRSAAQNVRTPAGCQNRAFRSHALRPLRGRVRFIRRFLTSRIPPGCSRATPLEKLTPRPRRRANYAALRRAEAIQKKRNRTCVRFLCVFCGMAKRLLLPQLEEPVAGGRGNNRRTGRADQGPRSADRRSTPQRIVGGGPGKR